MLNIMPVIRKILKHIEKPEGFTLIELLMAIVLLGIVGAGISVLLFQGTKSFEITDITKDLKEDGTLAVERLSREIRLVRCTTAGNNCNPQAADIISMTATELRFVNINGEGRGVRYDSGAGTMLLRQGSGAGDPEDILVTNVSAMTITYLKKDSTAAAAAADVWRINISFTLTKGDTAMSFEAAAHPRSFR
ncbi:MAG: prepilin-type N-terminal cleavage/methylation domain-containing protein [Deltaproteobacteria bacterium]|nr:prepilin-type N-terminal cleavage/methylation domain-containing protein [Deltaproteobacteria bacterium]